MKATPNVTICTNSATHVGFGKVNEPFGWLGNMAPYPVSYNNKTWKTTEHLFQALRFEDPKIIEEIRSKASPMSAKWIAKRYKDSMIVKPQSANDVENMRMVLRLKLKHHPQLIDGLLKTGHKIIYEDVASRKRGSALFWGMYFDPVNSVWKGENMLGKLWMELRDALSSGALTIATL